MTSINRKLASQADERGGADRRGRQLNDPALELLYEVPGLPVEFLPPPLGELYGGELGFRKPVLYANFVTSLDGVTAVDPNAPGQGGLISGGAPADRFLMGLLRAFAEVVVIGAGTLRAEARHLWTAERVYPPAADAFGELRQSLGLPPGPRLAVVTGTGNVDPTLPALAGGLVLTTEAGASHLGDDLPDGVKVVALGDGPLLDARKVVEVLHAEGHRTILSEGGPHLFGDLLAAGLVNELFLTISPVLAGRERTSAQLGLVEGMALLPLIESRWRLLSVRRSADHVFLRYRLA
jgi:riboflavin biosynthesis pyrimidine reductase